MIDPNAKRMRAALERIAEARWCSGDDLRDVAREALGLPIDGDSDDPDATYTGPDIASLSVALKRAYDGRAFEVLAHRSPFMSVYR
jgi:hypothetical protein